MNPWKWERFLEKKSNLQRGALEHPQFLKQEKKAKGFKEGKYESSYLVLY